MVTNNHTFEEQTRRLLSEAKSEQNAINEQITTLQNEAVLLAREVNAYETALQGYLRRIGKQTDIEIDWDKLLAEKGTHKDRIKLIAEQKGGTIRVTQVTDLLYVNGFIKAKKRATAYTMVQSMLADMVKNGEFEKLSPGEYRLVGVQQSLLDNRLT